MLFVLIYVPSYEIGHDKQPHPYECDILTKRNIANMEYNETNHTDCPTC